MKQLPMTPELSAMIKKAVGNDVDTSKLAVFEARALNTNPLPGKDGTIFERAVVEPITLIQMADYINGPNGHLPLVADHELFGPPKGRVFYAGMNYDDAGTPELRELFYLDETETPTIAKLNAGSLDEVSVSFLSSQFLCSECGWDYFSGEPESIQTRTCANGHTIGTDGVHARMVGLQHFVETSLVARGAADTPKIVGQSESKLAPETVYRLAAKGFEPNALVVHASMGIKEDKMDNAALTADLSGKVADLTGKFAVADAERIRLSAELTAVQGRETALTTRVSELETELTAAKAAKPEDYETSKTEAAAGVAFLQSQFNHLRVAKGETKLEGDALPKTVAELQAKIKEYTANLTSIIPVGGRSNNGGTDADNKTLDASMFQVRK